MKILLMFSFKLFEVKIPLSIFLPFYLFIYISIVFSVSLFRILFFFLVLTRKEYHLNYPFKDPLYESLEEVPFVSSSAHSRLIIRAVLQNNKKLLQDLVKNKDQIYSLHVQRSMANDMTGLR